MNLRFITEGNEANEVRLLRSLYLLLLLLIGLLWIGLLSGCAGGGLFTRTATVTPVVQTNAPATALPILTTNYVTNIVYSVNPGVTNALGTAKTVAQDAGGPWGMIVSGGLGLVAAGLTWIAKRKSDQKAALLPAIITGVESAETNQEVKESIEKVARAAGVESRLNAAVQKITK